MSADSRHASPTGVVHFTNGRAEAQVYLREGRVVHAQLGRLVGEEAFHELATWLSGEVKFIAGMDSRHTTIEVPTATLLAEAQRRLEEWKVLARKIPSPEVIPEFVTQIVKPDEADLHDRSIRLNRMKWLVISQVDGRRTLEQVADACGLSLLDTAKVLYGMMATGLMQVRLPTPGRRQPPSVPVLEKLLPIIGRQR